MIGPSVETSMVSSFLCFVARYFMVFMMVLGENCKLHLECVKYLIMLKYKVLLEML
jgi:hypothetical protein